MMGKMMGKWKDCWWLRTYWKTCCKFAFATDLVIQTLAMLLLVDFSKRSHHWCATNEQNDFMLIFMWRFPKMGRPQVTMAFNTKVMVIHDLDDSGVSP